jgi:hypothetical protein
MYGIVEAAYLLDDAELSARAYELLRPYADLPVVVSLGVLCLGSAQHPLGVAALCTGELDRAVEHLAAAVRDNLALRHWPALIMSRVRYAQALTRRGRAGDRSLAREVMATARTAAASLGLPLPAYDAQPVRERAATCRRAGQQWLVRYGGRDIRLPPSVGLLHLAVLLASPGREIPAVELATGLSTLHTAGVGASASGLNVEPERARLAVGKAIRRTIAAITRIDAQLGAHLTASVKTGIQCSYRPADRWTEA